jgi:hypothetical protein
MTEMSVIQHPHHKQQNFKHITHTFLSGKLSSTLIIPINIARKYGLDKPSNVTVEEHPEGILIRKLEI